MPVAQAVQVVNVYGTNAESVFTFLDTAFDKQSAIVGTTTNAMSYDDVVKLVSDWATYNTGVTSANYYTGMDTTTTVGSQCSVDARNTWKYIALQGSIEIILCAVEMCDDTTGILVYITCFNTSLLIFSLSSSSLLQECSRRRCSTWTGCSSRASRPWTTGGPPSTPFWFKHCHQCCAESVVSG